MIRGGASGTAPTLPGLFVPAYQQLNCVKSRNITRKWGFTDEHFEKLGEPPAWPSGLLSAVVLDVGLDTISHTFEEAWACIVESQKDHNGNHWRWDSIKTDKDHLRLYGGKSHERGLKWRIIDFDAHWDKKDGVKPQDVRGANSPDSACLWAASYFPKYVQAMDGENVPYMWIPGYELNVDGSTPWAGVPGLRWVRVYRRVRLYAGFADNRYQIWAVPSPRGCSGT